MLTSLGQVGFDDSEPLHFRLLFSLYRKLRPAAPLPPRLGPHWDLIGFQGDDPKTDFRGVGMLGLAQLLALVDGPSALSPEDAQTILDLSNHPTHAFPLSAVGLNFTKFITLALRNGQLNWQMWKQESVVGVVNGVYRGAFIRFYRLWDKHKCTIVDFARISKSNVHLILKVDKLIRRRPGCLLKTRCLGPRKPALRNEVDPVTFQANKADVQLPGFSDIVENHL